MTKAQDKYNMELAKVFNQDDIFKMADFIETQISQAREE
jgi:hypothetical protein